MGGARERSLASSTYAPYTWRLLTFMGWNWKCHVIIVIKTGSGGVCCPNALGLVQTVRQIPRVNALGIWLPVSHPPSCIGATSPSRTGLNPLNKQRASDRLNWLSSPLTACQPPKYPVLASVQTRVYKVWMIQRFLTLCDWVILGDIVRLRTSLKPRVSRDFSPASNSGPRGHNGSFPGKSQVCSGAGGEDQVTWLNIQPGYFIIFF